MLTYFDTSALVPLLVDEASTRTCADAWNAAHLVSTSAIAYVEVHAALAQAMRQRRMDAPRHRRALEHFETIWEDMLHLPVDEKVIRQAALITERHRLRGYDAVHCATAVAVASDDFIAVSGDRDLLRAWSELGIAAIDTAG